MRRRSRTAVTERGGVNAVEAACLDLNLIWRDLLQEDVGVDGTIEIAIGDFPSGKLVGAQVKSGRSYIRSETSETFKFYPRADDLAYWRQLSIPLFLLVHDPDAKATYWLDVTHYVEERADDPLGVPYLLFRKSNLLDSSFASHLGGLFNLAHYDDARFQAVRAELEVLSHTMGEGTGRVTVTGLGLFLEGLWGLCSKVQFHASLLSDIVRRAVRDRGVEFLVRYSFARTELYPFIIGYIDILSRHHLAIVDSDDVNDSLYRKLEYPTFIAPLTTNGRRFVEHLRAAGREDARDHQYFTLSLIPHEQIEVYASFTDGEPGTFGTYTDVMGISFNPHLDYYRVEHWRRTIPTSAPVHVTSQNMTLFELTDHIERSFGHINRDRILLRHLDIPLTPLISWLEEWYGLDQPFSPEHLQGKSNVESYGFHDEIVSIMGAVGSMELSEPRVSTLPLRRLASGEMLDIQPVND